MTDILLIQVIQTIYDFKPLCMSSSHTESFLFHYLFHFFILLKSRSHFFVSVCMFCLVKHLFAGYFTQIQTNIYFPMVSFSVFYK